MRRVFRAQAGQFGVKFFIRAFKRIQLSLCFLLAGGGGGSQRFGRLCLFFQREQRFIRLL
ncbi:hypothetical protein CSE899_17647 [Cronobacter sakazakii E899]|nr:hypothetical protein CSE899_17647 [Cronobacter sakazakii E899]